MNENFKEQQEIIKENINQMKRLLEDMKTWERDKLEKYLSDIILQNIVIKEQMLKEISEKIDI